MSAWPFVVVILAQMAVGGFSVYSLSAIRTFVAGESFWSKGQHQAVYFLSLYLDTHNPKDLASFQKAIAVPTAYRKGREDLESNPPDPAGTRAAFIAGGTAAEDTPAVIWMFRNFRGFSYLERAITKWKEADPYILELKQLGDAVEFAFPTGHVRDLQDRVKLIDAALNPRAIEFARTLDDGARVVERLLLIANFALAVIFATLTIWRVGRVLKQRRQYEDALSWQASHDELTGIWNRRAFEQCFTRSENSRGDRAGSASALLYIDLDQFKLVNDTCGHAAGDALLRRICSPIQQLLGPHDHLARLGGDEFSVLLADIDMESALALAERLRVAIEQLHFSWNGRTFGVTASIGLVHAAAGAPITPEEMLTKADMACFMAKEKGRNRVHAHGDEDQELLDRVREMNWVQRIQQALSEDRFCLYGQEIVPLTDCEDKGLHLEILIRLREESGLLVPPSSFIPAAERFGLMTSIDRWVVTRTFRTLAERRMLKSGTPVTCCAINLSGGTFGDGAFLDFLKKAFNEFRISPHIVCFEVTETTAIVNLEAARAFVGELRALGCTFALDDFGSGMSSFNYLKELPVDYLKIDGTFVKNLLTDRPDRAMVEMISHVGHIMGKRIVAEFVETDSVADALRDIGVDYGQGYGLAAPKPFDAHFEGSATARSQEHSRERLIA